MNKSLKELTFTEMAKIAEDNSCVLLTKAEWDAFTKKLWQLDEELKRIKKTKWVRSKDENKKNDDDRS